MNHIRIAANRAIFNILLLGPARWIKWNDDSLSARGADVRPFIPRKTPLFLPLLFHAGALGIIPIVAANTIPLARVLFLRILLILLRLLNFPLANLVPFAHMPSPKNFRCP
jgi:hypothetical protein